MFVGPEEQGREIGRSIVLLLLDEAKSRGLDHVTLSSSTASKGFYDRLGFRTVRKSVMELEGGGVLDYPLMRTDFDRSP